MKSIDEFQNFLLSNASEAHLLNFQTVREIKKFRDYCLEGLRKHIRIPDSSSKEKINEFRENWYNTEISSFENSTSGTTGERFKYLIWKDAYSLIEGNAHYRAVAEEFNLTPSNTIQLQLNKLEVCEDKQIRIIRTKNPILSHGFGETNPLHQAVANKTFVENPIKYYHDLLNYIKTNKFDILLTDGMNTRELVHYIQRLNFKGKVATLLSNTNSKIHEASVKFLIDNKHIDNFCDHMRCWDGGATFMTCKYNKYHLMDGLSWAYSKDSKLISSDYYSLPSVFYNYWSGDAAEVSEQYQLCECGRNYREFRFLNSRSKRSPYFDKDKVIEAMNIIKSKIIKVESVDLLLRIYTNMPVEMGFRKAVRNKLPGILVQFMVINE